MNPVPQSEADATIVDVAAQTFVSSGIAAILVAAVSAAFLPMPSPFSVMIPIALIPPSQESRRTLPNRSRVALAAEEQPETRGKGR